MKKILITGANSYIGTSFEKWLQQWPYQYVIDTIDMKDGNWVNKNFSGYDVVFHVAGIAHVDTKKASKETQDLYYTINRDLTIKTATKAKEDGVKQFIFMSSIIVYGDSSPIGVKRVITKDTIPNPSNFYGESKFQAEQGILPMQSDSFNVVVLRPPMIYGKESKGNYPRLARLAKKCLIFPDIDNERSMLYIGNLCEFMRKIIDHKENGTFFPQNKEYVRTTEMVKIIAELHQKKLHVTKLFNPIIMQVCREIGIINKVFGNLVYDKSMSEYRENYCINSFRETIRLTEL